MNQPTPRLLVDIARECREVFNRAAKDLGNDLRGFSLLDLCADNITDVSLADLKSAIIVAGLYLHVSPRIQRQIAAYQ